MPECRSLWNHSLLLLLPHQLVSSAPLLLLVILINKLALWVLICWGLSFPSSGLISIHQSRGHSPLSGSTQVTSPQHCSPPVTTPNTTAQSIAPWSPHQLWWQHCKYNYVILHIQWLFWFLAKREILLQSFLLLLSSLQSFVWITVY